MNDVTHLAVVQTNGLGGDGRDNTISHGHSSAEDAISWVIGIVCEHGGVDSADVKTSVNTLKEYQQVDKVIWHISHKDTPVHGYVIQVK